MREIDGDEQFLHVKIENGNVSLFCTMIYTNPQGRERNELWGMLNSCFDNDKE